VCICIVQIIRPENKRNLRMEWMEKIREVYEIIASFFDCGQETMCKLNREILEKLQYVSTYKIAVYQHIM